MRFINRIVCSVFIFAIGIMITSCEIGVSRKTTIRFWNGFTGPDGRTMLRMVKQFNRENPDIHVLMQRMDWGTYYNKLFVAGLGNRAPEIFILHADNIPRFTQADFVRPIDDLVHGANGMDESDFSEYIWEAVKKGEYHYGLPLDVHILGMYYNKRMFREAGIVDEHGEPRPPTNRDEFLDALRKMTRDTNNDGVYDTWGYVFTWFRTNVFTMMCQWGGNFLTDDGSRCIMNSAVNIDALQFCVDLIRKYKVSPPPENFDSWIGFRQGKVGIAFEGIYMLADLQKQKDLDFAGAPLPLLGNQPAAWAGSHTLCIRKGIEGAKLDAAWRFIKYVSDHSLDWAEGGQIPVRKSLRDTERFKSMTIQWQFAQQIPYIRYSPNVTFVFEFFTEFDMAIEKALRGAASPKEALDTATENVNTIIARQQEIQKPKT